MKTIDKIITKVSTHLGAPMGRYGKGTEPANTRIYNRKVNLDSGGYDKGGVYWGLGPELRVKYTKDLKYIEFYRD